MINIIQNPRDASFGTEEFFIFIYLTGRTLRITVHLIGERSQYILFSSLLVVLLALVLLVAVVVVAVVVVLLLLLLLLLRLLFFFETSRDPQFVSAVTPSLKGQCHYE